MTGTAWGRILVVIGAAMVGAFQVGKVPVALPAIRAELGLGLGAAGWILSIFSVIGVSLGLALGLATGRFGARRFALAGLLVIALGSLWGSLTATAPMLLASRVLEGLGFIMLVVAGPGLLLRLARSQDLRMAFGLWGCYMPAGQALMMLLAPLFLVVAGWRGLWLANAVLALACALALGLATRTLAPAVPTPPRRLLGDVARTLVAPGPVLLALSFGCYTLQYAALTGFLPTILIEREGYAPGVAAVLSAAVAAANMIGNLLAGRLRQDGVADWKLIAAASLGMALTSFGIFIAGVPVALAIVLSLAFSAIGGLLPATVLGAAPLRAPAPHLASASNGLVVQGSHVGQLAGPPALGALVTAHGGWDIAPVLLVAVAAGAVALAVALSRVR